MIAASPKGGVVRLRDLAEVEDGLADSVTISRIAGQDSIEIDVQKQDGANAVSTATRVKKEIAALESSNKATHFRAMIIQDDSSFTMESVRDVYRDILIAILLVGMTMYLFLHSMRNTAIVLIAIPTTLLATMIVAYLAGFTLNLISLMSLTLVVGILVDDSIVVIENSHRFLEMGHTVREAAVMGRGEIAFAAVSITLVDVVTFFPVSLVGGLVGNILRQFSLVIVIATLFSLFVSFTLTPLLYSRISRLEPMKGKFALSFERTFEILGDLFASILRWALSHRAFALACVGVLLAASLGLVAAHLIGTEFMPSVDRGQVSIILESPEQSSLADTNRTALEAERIIAGTRGVSQVQTMVGYSSTGLGQSSNNTTSFTVNLVPKERRALSADRIAQALEAKLSRLPGTKVKALSISVLGISQDPVQFSLIANDLKDLDAAYPKVMGALKSISGTGQIRSSRDEGKPKLDVRIDRSEMAALGLTLDNVGSALRLALSGNSDLTYREDGKDSPITVTLDDFNRRGTDAVSRLTFVNAQGATVRLDQFATIVLDRAPAQLSRYGRQESIDLTTQAIGIRAGAGHSRRLGRGDLYGRCRSARSRL